MVQNTLRPPCFVGIITLEVSKRMKQWHGIIKKKKDQGHVWPPYPCMDIDTNAIHLSRAETTFVMDFSLNTISQSMIDGNYGNVTAFLKNQLMYMYNNSSF